MTLRLVATRWYSPDVTVMDGSQPVADIDVSWWREQGVLTVQGAPYDVYREGLVSGAFILEQAGTVLARAEKPSAMRRTFLIHYAGRTYTLRTRSAYRRTLLLLDGSRRIGSIAPQSLFTRRADADLPDTWPLPVRVFIIWLSVILWRRDAM